MRTIRTAYSGSLLPYIRYVTITIFRNADTVTIRMLLAAASFLFGVFLLMDPSTFNREAWAVMKKFGNEYCWAFLFLLHWAGVTWRLYDPTERVGCALVINAFGFVIWAVMTLSINLAVQHFTPGTALEWTLVAASGWALYRTGLRGETVSA